MRPARIFVVAAVAVLALAAAAVAAAMRAPVDDGTLSVRDGKGIVVLRMKGGVIGRLARGRITVTEGSDTATVVIRGEDRSGDVNERTTFYAGTNIRFRIADDRRFTVRIEGNKINLSAVGRGNGFLDGRGNPEQGVFFDGSYSLNGEEYESIPDFRQPFELAASPSSP
jgi:glucose/arabinose dehydrogenase